MKANQLLSMLFGHIFSDIGPQISLVCPEDQRVIVEALTSADDNYQLILRGKDLAVLASLRLALLNRLRVSSLASYLLIVPHNTNKM